MCSPFTVPDVLDVRKRRVRGRLTDPALSKGCRHLSPNKRRRVNHEAVRLAAFLGRSFSMISSVSLSVITSAYF